MKAGASSMWASCCGLLNEVMGTGAVRTQQPGFGAGAGPFRFAPSAGYSTYPPSSTTSGSAGLACKACGLAFSVFRRKASARRKIDSSHLLFLAVENVSNSLAAVKVIAYPPPICNGGIGDGVQVAQLGGVDENLCRICMDAVIDCVLLECGHMVTCTKCGKRMSECPICRQYVVRAVHVFKS
ncbi:E3 ubiquitin-protein ligase RNF34 [Garra rufa]|uniref:E3 ubiquitin-protein ligase RNF34 n=1 Tax=Garra rufa TaxID=137080 RepID=UPI003CCE7A51